MTEAEGEPHAAETPPAPSENRTPKFIDSARRLLDQHPWLLPAASFALGWLGFFLFQRGENLARVIALIALLGWPWLMAENALGRWIVMRSKGRLSIGAVRFVTQQVQQEILFFALPFLFGAMVVEPGQVLFMALAVAVALLVTLDPIYLHRLAPHPGLSSALHAYCTFIAALVVLPMALHLPLERALPLAWGIAAASLLISLPRMLAATPSLPGRAVGLLALALALGALWGLRSWIPPAGLWVREARLTDRIDGHEPGAAITQLGAEQLRSGGMAAFVAVRAPSGLSQAVIFEWRQGEVLVDRIPAEISGGREAGFRTYSRKRNFPDNPAGDWRVDLRTPQGQLVARLRLRVNP